MLDSHLKCNFEVFVQRNAQENQGEETQGPVVRGTVNEEQSSEQVEAKQKGPLDGDATPCTRNAALIEAARKGRDMCEREIRLITEIANVMRRI